VGHEGGVAQTGRGAGHDAQGLGQYQAGFDDPPPGQVGSHTLQGAKGKSSRRVSFSNEMPAWSTPMNSLLPRFSIPSVPRDPCPSGPGRGSPTLSGIPKGRGPFGRRRHSSPPASPPSLVTHKEILYLFCNKYVLRIYYGY
jgi:hypothetical protein